MKKVLVIGSTGAMGQYLVPILSEMGYSVDAVSLDNESISCKNVKAIKANVFEQGVLDEFLKNHYDGVVDFMNYGGDSFYHVYKKFLNNTDHYIFLSSCRIYANEENERLFRQLEKLESAEAVTHASLRYFVQQPVRVVPIVTFSSIDQLEECARAF